MTSPVAPHAAEVPARTVAIRSFRVVFALERRLFKVDRFRLPLAYGIPVRAVAYAAALLLAVIVLGRLPVIGTLINLIPPPMRYVAGPAGAAAVLTRVRVDGLPAHHALRLAFAHRLRRRRLTGFAADRVPRVTRSFTPVLVAPDELGPQLRPGVLSDASAIAVRVPVSGSIDSATLFLRQTGSRPLRTPRRIRIPAGARVVIRP